MSFDKLMASVVGKRILSDATLRKPWDEFSQTRVNSALSSQCNGAQGMPDTEQAALYYCLTYQKSHYDALAAVMAAGIDATTPLLGRWLVVDFGAGPGTALLAWASYVRNGTNAALKATYVHVDNLKCMFHVCNDYFQEDSNIAAGSTMWSEPDLTNGNDIDSWARDCDHIIFMFSYVLCQLSVTSATVEAFAKTIVDTCAALTGKPAYLLMVDTNLSRTRWPELLNHLGTSTLNVSRTVSIPPLSIPTIYLDPHGTERDRRQNDGRMIYEVIRLQ